MINNTIISFHLPTQLHFTKRTHMALSQVTVLGT